MIKRIYSSLLALVMVVGLLPTTAWADEPDAGSGTTTTISRFNCPTDGCTVTTTDGTSSAIVTAVVHTQRTADTARNVAI